jgi:hypothetical protein
MKSTVKNWSVNNHLTNRLDADRVLFIATGIFLKATQSGRFSEKYKYLLHRPVGPPPPSNSEFTRVTDKTWFSSMFGNESLHPLDCRVTYVFRPCTEMSANPDTRCLLRTITWFKNLTDYPCAMDPPRTEDSYISTFKTVASQHEPESPVFCSSPSSPSMSVYPTILLSNFATLSPCTTSRDGHFKFKNLQWMSIKTQIFFELNKIILLVNSIPRE